MYRVRWEIDVPGIDPVAAALEAFNIMQQPRDPNDVDSAVVFSVSPVPDGAYTYAHVPEPGVEVDLAQLGVRLVPRRRSMTGSTRWVTNSKDGA